MDTTSLTPDAVQQTMSAMDPISVLVTQGPLGLLAAIFLWLWLKERDAREKDRTFYDSQTEKYNDALIEQQDKRIGDLMTVSTLVTSTKETLAANTTATAGLKEVLMNWINRNDRDRGHQ